MAITAVTPKWSVLVLLLFVVEPLLVGGFFKNFDSIDFESLLFVKSPLFASGQDFFVLFLLAIGFITFSLK